MGTDIIFHLEARRNGKWFYVGEVHILRNYEVFARLANIKNRFFGYPALSDPRGLPNDISFDLMGKLPSQFDSRDHDNPHDASWLTLREIWFDGKLVEYIGGSIDELLFGSTPDVSRYSVNDIRAVFFFVG